MERPNLNTRGKLKKKDWIEFNEKLLKQEFLKYQDGSQFSILEAIQICALSDIKMPDWVAEGYLVSFGKLKKLEAGSLDDAFGFKCQEKKPTKNSSFLCNCSSSL
jgi:hypothetical protein